jgi:hypothetical protein
MNALYVSRRQVLTLAGATLGLGVVELVAGSGPAAAAGAAPAGQPTLQPIPDTPIAVLCGDGSAPVATPRQLAVRVVRTTELPAGARVTITFDPRLYTPLTSALVSHDGRPVRADKAITNDPGTGLHTSTVTLAETVPATGDLVIAVATAHPLRYPYDLIRRPTTLPVSDADVRRTPRDAGSRRQLRAERPSSFGGPAQPWGIELDAVWGGRSWGADGKYHYPVPVRVTLHSVGPGSGPAETPFVLSVDPRLVSAVKVSSVELDRRPFGKGVRQLGTSRTASVHQSSWSVPVQLKPGSVLDVYLDITTVPPGGPLTGITYPVLTLAPTAAAASQRLTGKETLTRTDLVCGDTADG